MPLFAFEGREPQVSPGAWIAPTAALIGDVRVEAEASIWYGAAPDEDRAEVGAEHGAVPDGGFGLDPHVPDQGGGGGDPGPGADLRLTAFEGE